MRSLIVLLEVTVAGLGILGLSAGCAAHTEGHTQEYSASGKAGSTAADVFFVRAESRGVADAIEGCSGCGPNHDGCNRLGHVGCQSPPPHCRWSDNGEPLSDAESKAIDAMCQKCKECQ